MDDKKLIWIIGKAGYIEKDADGRIKSGSGFAGHEIDTTNCRKSINTDKEETVLMHHTKLTATQLNSIWGVPGFKFYDDTTSPTITELMASEEWVSPIKDGDE